MGSARNAPCPCGSGAKFKRCCAARAHDRRAEVRHEERVGRAAEEWAFEQFGDELLDAGRRLIAQLGDSPNTTWIAGHWSMLDYELRTGGTAAARFAELPDLDATDREIAERIAASRVGVLAVRSCRPGDGIDLVDLRGGRQFTVRSTDISRQARAADLLLARVMHGGSATSLWGPARVFSPREAGLLRDELAGLDPPELLLRDAWPRLLTLDTSAPELVTRAAWDIHDVEEVFDALPDALEYERVAEDGADVFVWRIGPGAADLGGFFELYDDGIVAWTFAESLLDDAIVMIDRALGSRAHLAERETVDLLAAPQLPDRRRAA